MKKGLKLITLIVVLALVCAMTQAETKKQGLSLPQILKAVVNALYPSAAIEKVETEQEGIEVIEVVLKQGEQECSVSMAEDGTVLEIESQVSMDSLPDAVHKAIRQAARGAKIQKVEKEEIRAVVQVVKLPEPQIVYEAACVKDGVEYEIEVASCGKVLSMAKAESEDEAADDEEEEAAEDDDEDDGDDDDDHDDDEDDDDDDEDDDDGDDDDEDEEEDDEDE